MDTPRVSSSEKSPETRPSGRTRSAHKPGSAPAPGAFLAMLSGMEDGASVAADGGLLQATSLLGAPAGQGAASGPADTSPDTDPEDFSRDPLALAAALWQPWAAGHAVPSPEVPGGTAGGLTARMTGKHAGSKGGVDSMSSAALPDAGGLLASSLWVGHAQSAESLVAQTGRIDTARDALPMGPAGSTDAQRGAGKKTAAATAAGAAAAQLVKASTAASSFAAADAVSAASRAGASFAAVASGAGMGDRGQGLSSNSVELASIRVPGSFSSAAALADVSQFMAAAMGSTSQARGGEAGQKQNSGGATYSDIKGAFVPGVEPGSDFSSMAADPALGAAEDAVAEQVTYWLTENLKNAQLTLDHEGQAVNVRVSLAGNEAHVAFRSDQAHTRALLDAHIADLRDLLQREGLVLSGMTVDAHGAGASTGGGDSQPREGRQTARVAPAGDTGRDRTDVQPRAARTNGVDLFV